MFTSSSSKTLPFETHTDNNNMGVYRDNASFSFSSYFNTKLTDHSTRYLTNPKLIPGSGAAEDGEIGVFGAEKYFNGGMEEEGSQKSTNARRPVPVPATEPSQKLDKLVTSEPKPRLATPSVGSESSSVNSQKPLLNKNENSVGKRKSFLSNTLGYCICYSCHDNSAVDVGEISFSNAITTTTATNPTTRPNEGLETPSFRENHFSFPTGGSLKLVHFHDEEVERKSLEVFGSPVMGRLRNGKSISLEKRLAMLSWDHTNNNNLGGLFYNDDEVNSDCSSDLFEIESLTKQTNPFQSPTASCYAPSEASVEWSVVTASALDFDERRPSTASPARMLPPPPPSRREVLVVQKRRSSSLLGCKSEKAVRVAEESNGRKMSANSNSDHQLIVRRKSQSARFEGDTKVGGFSFRSHAPPSLPPPRALAKSSLPRPFSPRLSNITFNIQ